MIITSDLAYKDVPLAKFYQTVFQRHFSVMLEKDVSAAGVNLDLERVTFTRADDRGCTEVFGWLDKAAVYTRFSASSRKLEIAVAADDELQASAVLAKVESWAIEAQLVDTKVDVSFWTLTNNGPRCYVRSLDVPHWKDVAHNYATNVGNEVSRVIEEGTAAGSGKLILWYGPPGTGKTYAIRALLREWRERAILNYIVDPEKFFGGDSDYMLEVILGGNHMPDDEDNPPKTMLLLLEDTGELLQANAKDNVGQGLSRLLNVVDGLIGQGLNIVTLITSNEKIQTFHPAVLRPGRCLSKLEIDRLSVTEANQWLRGAGSDITVSEDKTLAELFALAEQRHLVEREVVAQGQYL